MNWLRIGLLWLALASSVAEAGGGPLGIDHEIGFDQSGIWARKYQTGLENGVIALELAGALWFGRPDYTGRGRGFCRGKAKARSDCRRS